MRGLGTKNDVEDVTVAIPYTLSAYEHGKCRTVLCSVRFFVLSPKDIAGGAHFAHRGYGRRLEFLKFATHARGWNSLLRVRVLF